MSNPHRFHSLRFQIVLVTALVTVFLSAFAGVAFSLLSDRSVKHAAVQSSEFNLTLVAASVQQALDNANLLLAWGCTDSSVRRYLTYENVQGGYLIQAYDNAQNKYRSSPIQQSIVRFLVTNEEGRYLQFGSATGTSAALTSSSVQVFCGMGEEETTGWHLIAQDPLAPPYTDLLTCSRPIVHGTSRTHIGTAYIELSSTVLTDPLDGYNLTDGSRLYWYMNGGLWEINRGVLTPAEGFALEGTPYRSVTTTSEKTRVLRTTQEGRPGLLVIVPLEDGMMLAQFLPDSALYEQRMAYLYLIIASVVLVLFTGALLMLWLNHKVSGPVAQLRRRIQAIGEGDFSNDPAIEWENELGDVGRGINQLSVNVSSLLERRLADQKQKQDLEYRMLQNQVNPHFIYNTLNGIRWMATIQHAQGIAEMVTALSRLLKSVSKGNEKLISLQEELALLNDYFTIQQYRYGGDVYADVAYIESERICRECRIPRFTLQPLAENSIFHGLEPKGGVGSILLDIRTDGGDVVITLTDDGVGMTPEQLARALQEPTGADAEAKYRHVGLWNVHRRIQYSFGPGYGLTLASEPGQGTTVRIRLPFTHTDKEEQA